MHVNILYSKLFWGISNFYWEKMTHSIVWQIIVTKNGSSGNKGKTVLSAYVKNQALLEPILLYCASKCKQTIVQDSQDCFQIPIFTLLGSLYWKGWHQQLPYSTTKLGSLYWEQCLLMQKMFMKYQRLRIFLTLIWILQLAFLPRV